MLVTAQSIMSAQGFSGVGLSTILQAAGVPKGSFYHYFDSKEAFGQSLLERYFENYLAAMDGIFAPTGDETQDNGAARLQRYLARWQDTQTAEDAHSKCLVVKLAAEVADLSEAMRQVLNAGTARLVARLADVIDQGQADGTIRAHTPSHTLAAQIYQIWLGASLMAKITKDADPFVQARISTRTVLHAP